MQVINLVANIAVLTIAFCGALGILLGGLGMLIDKLRLFLDSLETNRQIRQELFARQAEAQTKTNA